MEQPWFRKTDNAWCWKPLTWQAWFITLIWGGGNAYYFLRIDRNSNSISDTLIGFAPYFILSTLIYLAIVRSTCARDW